MTGRDGPFPSFRARAIGPPRGVDGHVRGLVLVFDCVIRPYPGRWTTHLVISDPSDLDAEMYGWIDQAYEFANPKQRLKNLAAP